MQREASLATVIVWLGTVLFELFDGPAPEVPARDLTGEGDRPGRS